MSKSEEQHSQKKQPPPTTSFVPPKLQDRKRAILERQRSRRRALSRSTYSESDGAPPSSAPPNTSPHSSSSLSKKRRYSSTSSLLFGGALDDVVVDQSNMPCGGNMSRSSSVLSSSGIQTSSRSAASRSSYSSSSSMNHSSSSRSRFMSSCCAPETKHISDTNLGDANIVPTNENTPPPKQRRSSTLFGAVMQRSSHHQTSINDSFSRAATKPSPGGYRLSQVLDSVLSPFKGAAKQAPSATTPSSSTSKQPVISDWRTASWDAWNGSILDWSIKQRVLIECTTTANMCSATSTNDTDLATSILRRAEDIGGFVLAAGTACRLQSSNVHVLSSGSGCDNNAHAGSGAGSGEGALYYWEYKPAPIANGCASGGGEVPTASKIGIHGNGITAGSKGTEKKVVVCDQSGSSHHQQQMQAERLLSSVWGPHSRIQQMTRRRFLGRGNEDDSSSALRTREQTRRRWQQAFQSLYQQWSDQLMLFSNNSSTAGVGPYFYAWSVSTEQVVLFRRGHNGPDGQQQDSLSDPMILVSSSSQSMRNELRRMGIIITATATGEPFQELEEVETRNTTTSIVSGKDNDDDEAATTKELASKCKADLQSPVRSDLEALRQLQVAGNTTGAQISFRRAPSLSKTTKTSSDRRSTSIFVRGWDDCDAFAEYFRNQRNDNNCSSLNPSVAANEELPTLWTRNVGPFWNASLQRLILSHERKQQHPWRQTGRSHHQHAPSSSFSTFLEFRGGPILPCALMDLVKCCRDAILEINGKNEGSSSFAIQTQQASSSSTSSEQQRQQRDHHHQEQLSLLGGVHLNSTTKSEESGIVGHGEHLDGIAWENAKCMDLLVHVQKQDLLSS